MSHSSLGGPTGYKRVPCLSVPHGPADYNAPERHSNRREALFMECTHILYRYMESTLLSPLRSY